MSTKKELPWQKPLAKKIARLLLDYEAVKLNATKPFIWASGWKSPIYCDNRSQLSEVFARNTIKKDLTTLVTDIIAKDKRIDTIAGVAQGATSWGVLVADILSLPFAYVREPKGHGLQNAIEGRLRPNSKVVVVEDLISTGASSLKVVKVLRDAGHEVLGVVALFDYGFKVAKQNFKKAGVPLCSLTNFGTLCQIAKEKGLFTVSEIAIMKQFSKDPANYQGTVE